MEHQLIMLKKTGTDQINSSGTTSINAYIQSGDFDISATRDITGQSTGIANFTRRW
jgi:hypothetical protein